jgi:tRNA(fMet)-specific endonuclease VapC
MRYLLDTNVCVDYLNGRFPNVTERIHRSSPDDLCLSALVVAELRYGADRSRRRSENHERLDLLTAEIPCVDFDLAAAYTYGKVRSALEAHGRPIGHHDVLIAAHALSLGLILVTDNTREVDRVDGLAVENWRQPPQPSTS